MYILESSIINLSNIISFLIGLVTGATILFIVLLAILSKEKKTIKKFYGPTADDLSEEEIQRLIKNKQISLLKEIEDNNKESLQVTFEMMKELVNEIAKHYYPNSKNPIYELTIEEAFASIHYIIDEFSKLFNKPIIKLLKHKKLLIFTNLYEKTKITRNSEVKKAKEVYDSAKTVKNTVNPIFWFRKVVVSGSLTVAIKKLLKSSLNVVGREADIVYSKKLFKHEEIHQKIDSEVELIIDSQEETDAIQEKN